MKYYAMATFVACLVPAAFAQATVYNAVPSPLPPNVPSLGYQCCATSEFGDQVQLEASTPRIAGSATVVMSDWAKHSDYPTMPAAGFMHPITLNIYDTPADATAHVPVATVTQNFLIQWRPEADPTCVGGTAWRSPVDLQCYNGFAFPITFDLRHSGPGGASVQLPNTLIYGIAFNTNTWGYHPIGLSGPYESLNVGLNVNPPTVGTNVELDVVYWNTNVASFYADGGTGGVGIFRRDTNWTPYTPAVRFTAFASPLNKDDCKNGGWQNLVKRDFTPFPNQGQCVSYVETGK